MMLQIGFTWILADYSRYILHVFYIQPACKCPKVLGIIPTSKYTKKMKRRRKAVFSFIQIILYGYIQLDLYLQKSCNYMKISSDPASIPSC